MGTRLDAVLAAGMARLSVVAPVPTEAPGKRQRVEGALLATPLSKLDEVEGVLEDLLGEKAMPMPRFIHLEPYGRMLVANFLAHPEQPGALAALARDIELSEEEAFIVVESEQKRIAKAAYRERNARKKAGPWLHDAVTQYVDALEAQSVPDALALRPMRDRAVERLKVTDPERKFRDTMYREQWRRNEWRTERDAPIDLHAPAPKNRGGKAWTLASKVRAATSSLEFQAVLAREARQRASSLAEEEQQRKEEEAFLRDVLDNPGSESPPWLTGLLDQWDEAFDYDALLADEDGVVEDPFGA